MISNLIQISLKKKKKIICVVILITLTYSATFQCDESICNFGVCNSIACNGNTYICGSTTSTCTLECASQCENIIFLSSAQYTQISCTKRNACTGISISIPETYTTFSIECLKNDACSSINIECADPNNCQCQSTMNNQQCINNIQWVNSQSTTTSSTTTTTTAQPTQFPTKAITSNPTYFPSLVPSKNPTKIPTEFPSKQPSFMSTLITINPTQLPTIHPSLLITENLHAYVSELSTYSTTPIHIATKNEIIAAHLNNSESKKIELHFILIVAFISILFFGICIGMLIYYSKYKRKKFLKEKFGDNPNDIEMHISVNELHVHESKQQQAMDKTRVHKITMDDFVIKSDSEESAEAYNQRMTHDKMNGENHLALPQSMMFAALSKDLPNSLNSNDEGMMVASVGSPSCDDIGSILYEPGIEQVTPSGEFVE